MPDLGTILVWLLRALGWLLLAYAMNQVISAVSAINRIPKLLEANTELLKEISRKLGRDPQDRNRY